MTTEDTTALEVEFVLQYGTADLEAVRLLTGPCLLCGSTQDDWAPTDPLERSDLWYGVCYCCASALWPPGEANAGTHESTKIAINQARARHGYGAYP